MAGIGRTERDRTPGRDRVRRIGVLLQKRLPEVLASHAASIKILHTLKPVAVAMAGEEVGIRPIQRLGSPTSQQAVHREREARDMSNTDWIACKQELPPGDCYLEGRNSMSTHDPLSTPMSREPQPTHEPLEWGTNCLQAPDHGPHECNGCCKPPRHTCLRCGAFCLCDACNNGEPRMRSSVSEERWVHTDTPVGRVMCIDPPVSREPVRAEKANCRHCGRWYQVGYS